MRFRDRSHAGRLLAAGLARYAKDPGLLVCALPRGGVVVAAAVAEALDAPLDFVIVRKLGVPGQPELAMGAIASAGVSVLSHALIAKLGISADEVEQVLAREQRELVRREVLYRGEAPAPQVRERTVILVDDGIATGATMRAAASLMCQQQPRRLVIAAPVASPSTCRQLQDQADEMVCVARPEHFFAIDEFYRDFLQVSDEVVRELLQRAECRIADRGKQSAA